MNESKKNISDTLKSKIEKAIDREASLLKKVEELQTSFSNSSEREMKIGKQLRELKHEREMGLNREIELKTQNKESESRLVSNEKVVTQLTLEIDEMKHKIDGYEFMWDNNMRPDGRPKNHSLISLEGRYHKVEDYNNELTDENKNLKLKIKDINNSQTKRSTSSNQQLKKSKNKNNLDTPRSLDTDEDSLARATRNFSQFSGEL